VNWHPRDSLERPEHSYVTSLLAAPDSPYFKQSRAAVLRDLERARAMKPDSIIVLPHMGTQFQHAPDAYAKTWMDIFVEGGADIVLADHPHAVQPIEWRQSSRSNRRALIVYCPGNYVNSYIDNNGDATAIVGVYLDPKSGSPQAASVVPMWGQAMMNGNFRALPVYEILRSPVLQKEISAHDLARVREVHSLVTSIMLGHDLSLDQIQEKYFLFPEGYARVPVPPIEIAEPLSNTRLYRLLTDATAACFVGDSVTAGTKNGGYGWYEPLTSAIPNLKVYRKAWGSYTVKMLLDRRDEIAAVPADVFVIAIGTNDVRYRSEKSSMTSEEYIANIDSLVQHITARRPQAKFVLIGAWTTDHYDPISMLPEPERMAMLARYRTSLESYANAHGHLYIDPNPGIEKVLRTEYARIYLKDHIHPNADQGIRLYSTKALEASPLENPARSR
jgi:lysophospholipase L1-like esterase